MNSKLDRARSPQEELNRRKLARINPWAFACYVDPDYAVPYSYPHAKLIFDHFRKAESGELWQDIEGVGARILIITLPPNHLKSSIINKCVAWYLGKKTAEERPRQIALASYSADLAETNSNAIINTIQDPLYSNIWPDAQLTHADPSPKKWSLKNEPMGDTCRAVGIGGGLTGHRARCFVIDDPIKNYEDAHSATTRLKQQKWLTTVALKRLARDSFLVMMLTRWHEDDQAGFLIKQAREHAGTHRIKLLRIPALAESEKERLAAFKMGLPLEIGDPLGREAGQALCPPIKNKAEHEAAKRLDPVEFSSLDQGLPRPLTGQLIGRDHFNILPLIPTGGLIKWAWCIDFAYTEKEQAPKRKTDPDFTALGKVGAWWPDPNIKEDVRLIIAHVKRNQLKLTDAKNMARDHILAIGGKPCPIVAFSQNIDKIGIQSLAVDPKLFAYPVKLFKSPYPRADKLVMAQPWISRAELGFVYLLAGAWNEDFLGEVETFPKGAHDDQVDFVSVGFYWHGLGNTRKKARSKPKPKRWFA